MSTISTINVPFHGANLCIVNHDGNPYVPMKPIIEGMGLDWASQFTKLKKRFSKGIVEIAIPSKGGEQSMICLAMHKLTGWLYSIMPNKVKPEIRDKVIQYQEECDDVLYEYWTTGEVKAKANNRQSTAKELTPLRQTAERLIATGVGNIYPDIWKYVHKEFGVEHINELLPEQIPQAISFLDALEGEYLPKQTERFVGCRVLHHYDDKGEIVKSEVATDDEQLTSPKVFADLAESRGYVMVKKDAVGAKFNKHKIAHTLEGAVIHIRAMKEYWNNGLKDSLKQLGYQHTGSMTEHMTDILFHLDWAIHEIKGDNLDKLPA